MIQEAKLLGCLAQFSLAGIVDVTTAGTVSKTFIPNNADVDASSNPLWVQLGIISDVKESTKPGASVEIYRPTPGLIQLDDVKESKYKRVLDLTVEECSPMMWLAMRRAFAPASIRTPGQVIGQFVSFTAGTVRGWIKFQSYNQDTNALELAEQFYCVMQIDGTNYGNDKNAKFDVKLLHLFSTLNTATGS